MKNLLLPISYILTKLKNYFMGFFSIFKKSNDYNEKVVIGFMSFMVMVIAISEVQSLRENIQALTNVDILKPISNLFNKKP